MPYQHISGTYGHSIYDVRAKYPNVSLPPGESYKDYTWYEPTVPDTVHITDVTTELPPVDGKQVWEVKRGESSVVHSYLFSELADMYSHHTEELTKPYPPTERESWPIQSSEAWELKLNDSAETPWIDAAATARGMSRFELMARIITKDRMYRGYHGAITGNRQRLEDLLDENKTDSEAMLQIDLTTGWPS